MANLISSKQISGVVTASLVEGNFEVSGSSHLTGSLNVSGSINASGNISGSSFIGDGSTLSNVETTGRGIFSGSEQLPAGLISSSQQLPAGIVSGAAQLLSTFDTRYLNTDGDGVVSGSFLSVGGLGVVSGSSQVSFTGLDNLPAGLVSGSIQILGSSGILSSSEQLPAGLISSSAQLHSDLDSRYATDLGEGIVSGSVLRPGGDGVISGSAQVDFDSLQNLPDGIISGSIQVLGSTGIVSSSEQLPGGLISSSEQLPAGVVSGSEQIVDALGSVNTYTASNDVRLLDIESTTSSLDSRITQLETDTGSQDSRLDSLESATSSYESIGSGIVSGAIQILGGSDVVSGSSQITYDDISGIPAFIGGTNVTVSSGSGGITINSTGGGGGGSSDITALNTYTASNDINISNIHSATSSLEQRVGQIESNTGSYDESSDIQHLNDYTHSSDTRLDGLSVYTSSTDTKLDGLNTYTSSTDQRLERIEFTSSSLETRVNDLASSTASINAFTGSVFISSSAQITALGFVSESSGASVGHLNNFTASTDIQLTNLESFTSSVEGTNEFTQSLLGTNEFTQSAKIRLNNIESTTSSFDGRLTNIESTTSSLDGRLDNVESTTSSFESRFGTIETETASIDARLDNIESATSSYETIGRDIVSGSSQLTSSYDERYEGRASGTKTLVSGSSQVTFAGLSNIPSGIISSSEQFPAGVVSGSIQILGGTGIFSGSEQLEDLGFRSGSLITGEVSDIELEMSGSGSFKRKALTNSYQTLEFISTPLFQTGSSNWTISDGSFVRITTSGTYLLNSNFTLFKANDNDRVALFKWQRSLNNSDWTDVSGSTFGIGSPSQEPDYAYGGGVSTTFFESGSYVRIVGKIDQSSEEPIALHNSDTEGGRSTVSMFLINGTNASGAGGSTDLNSLNPAVIDVTADSIGFIDDSASGGSRKESIVDLVNAMAGTGITPSNGQFNAVGPGGTISGSEQITGLGFISSSDSTTSLNTFTSSIQTEVDGLSAATSSYLTSLDSNIVSSSAQITALGFVSESSTPAGTISGSEQITSFGFISSSDSTTSLNTFTSSIQTEVDGLSAATSSYLTSLTSGIISSSEQLPGDLISGSAQITALGFVSESGDSTPAGTISGSAQITALGFVSESGGENSSLNAFTSSATIRLNNLESTTSSLDSRLDSVEAATGSYLTSSGSVDFTDVTSVPNGLVSGSIQVLGGTDIVSSSAQITSLGFISESTSATGTVSSSKQITDLGFISGSSVSSSISYNGNRIISQAHLQGFYTSSFNAGTSGSVIDFLDAIFFPNTEPSITSGNQTIAEFSASSAPIFTLEANDPEAQSITFGTASSYTDDLVRVASNGVVTLNALAQSSSFNTDLVGGSHGHTFTAKATDTFNASVEKDITIFVTPNAAPIFRETSVSGNQITNVTASLNENSADDTLVKRVFFTDAESDTITIDSSSVSPANHFSITKYSTYVDIRQNTGSLDYETYPLYTFSLSASDEHFQNSQDSDAISVLPVSISVVDNVNPTINNQTLSSINENSANGATVGNISATDSEGDSITFSQFTLYKLELDDSNVASGSYGGTSQLTDPHENPFQMNSAGQVTRKTGVLINSDLINEYQYLVTVRDAYNTASNEAIITIPITDDTPATVTDNWSAGPYIIESAASGSQIKVNSNGLTGTQAAFSANQSVTWTVSDGSGVFDINSSGQLSIKTHLTGSTTASGASISASVIATNAFGTTTETPFTASVTTNNAPDIIFVSSSILNTNQASASSDELVSIRFSDTEGDVIETGSHFTFTEPSGQLTASLSGSSFKVIATSQLSGSTTYGFTASIEDEHHFSTNTESQAITITQSDTGTLGGDTTSYIIESAVSGAVLRDATGFGGGNASQLTVSYSPSHGSPSVQSFTSSNPAIAVNNSGNLTLALNLSGSTTESGDTISTNITFDDQYGNTGSGSVTVNVFANQAPNASFTEHSSNFNTDSAVNGVTMVSMSISDTESDTPFSASLSGSDLQLVFTNADSSSVGIQATTSLTARVHTYSVSVFDQFGKSRTYSDRTFSVTQSADYGRVFVYDVGFNNATYNTAVGIDSEDGSTPPVATPHSNIGFLDKIKDDDVIGDSTFTYSYGGTQTATKLGEASGSNLHDVLRTMGSSGVMSRNSAKHFVILFPSGSDMTGIPLTTTDSYGGSTAHEYVLEVGTDGTTIDGSNTLEASEINQITLATSHVGYTKWFMVGATNQVASSTNFNLGLNPSSGSGGA